MEKRARQSVAEKPLGQIYYTLAHPSGQKKKYTKKNTENFRYEIETKKTQKMRNLVGLYWENEI